MKNENIIIIARLMWICNLTLPFIAWFVYPSKLFVIILYIIGVIGTLINYDTKRGENK